MGMSPAHHASDDEMDAATWCRHLVPQGRWTPSLPTTASSCSRPSGQTRAALRAAGHTQTIKPIPLSSAVPGGFTIHDFQIDAQAGTVRCPAGYTAPITSPGRGQLCAPLPALPAAGALHRRQGWAHDPGASARGRAARRRSPRDHAQLPGKLSALAADGGTLAGLAGAAPGLSRNSVLRHSAGCLSATRPR